MSQRRRVTATDLAEMGFCETKCRLKAELGTVDTVRSREAKRGGQQEHDRFHRQVVQHHNQAVDGAAGRGRDTRCFVATAVYGGTDPRTDELRQFRDTVLLPRRSGRLAVAVYYRVSPALVRLMRCVPFLRPAVIRILDFTRRRIAPFIRREAINGQALD